MRLLTPDQMRAIDKRAIEEIGVPGIVLMENAALQVSMKAADILNKRNGTRVLVLAGSGNNGGDALAVTRHLLGMGYSVLLFTLIPSGDYRGDARINADILINMGVVFHHLAGDEAYRLFEASLQASDLVIDGLFGTGLNRSPNSFIQKLIDAVNTHSPCTLAIDVPSGMNGLTGQIFGSCIKAQYTVTFFLPKVGMVQYPAASCLGELTVADISIPYFLADNLKTMEMIDSGMVAAVLPKRPVDSHKGTFGRVLVFAGSRSYTGAACLSALACYRTGSGLVRLASPSGIVPTLAAMLPEAVYTPLEDREGTVGEVDEGFIKELINQHDAVLIGPGLLKTPETADLLRIVLSICEKPLVIDADGLNLLAEHPEFLNNRRAPIILTPHPAEMGRLLNLSARAVQEDRIGHATSYAVKHGLTLILKGASTVVVCTDGRTLINPTGNSGMATAGSGDVLAGMLVSLLGQGMQPCDAALAAVYLHGLAGDLAAAEKGEAALMASDIANYIGSAMKEVLMK